MTHWPTLVRAYRGFRWSWIWFLLVALLPTYAHADDLNTTRVWLPIVRSDVTCTPSPEAAALADLMQTSPEQRRPFLRCNPVLEAVALAHARDMAQHGFLAHVSPTTGLGPNGRVRAAGYQLPTFYDPSPTGNTIESLIGGAISPASAWRGFLGSAGHRKHLLGLDPVFAEQTEYGIGYVLDMSTVYGWYYVIITAPPSRP